MGNHAVRQFRLGLDIRQLVVVVDRHGVVEPQQPLEGTESGFGGDLGQGLGRRPAADVEPRFSIIIWARLMPLNGSRRLPRGKTRSSESCCEQSMTRMSSVRSSLRC